MLQGQEKPNLAGKEGEEHKEVQAEKVKEKEREQQRQRMLRRSRSAVELRSMAGGLARHGSTPDLQQHVRNSSLVELTNPEGQTYTAGRLSNEERAQKILRSETPLLVQAKRPFDYHECSANLPTRNPYQQ
jgi:hypothetical protein